MTPAIGMLILLATLALGGAALVVTAIGLVRGRQPVVTGGILTGLTAVAGYGALWVAGYLTAPSRVFGPGEELSFCGLDCHLHVSVARVERAGDLAVVVRFRSDAAAAPEYPGRLRLDLVDRAGRRYRPAAGMVAGPLEPGATIEREFRFPVPPEAAPARLEVSYDGWLDYLIPGLGNPLARRKSALGVAVALRPGARPFPGPRSPPVPRA